MRVALVYDRLNKIGGAEAVLIQFAHLFPHSDWYTSVWDPKRAPFSSTWKVYTSWLNQIPFLRTHHEWIPFLMPFIFESFDFNQYDLVISIGSAECKGIITRPPTYHLNYCLTPTRYLYSHQKEYLTNPFFRKIGEFLRAWDQVAATRPDEMIAISTQVKNRIKDVYKRNAQVIFPPVDTKKFAKQASFIPPFTNYYLTVARLVPYKRLDLLIRCFNETRRNLVIVGSGSESSRLKSLAGPTVHLVGFVKESELISYYQHCQAFVQVNEEDFGLAMVESLACGKPVLAYHQGGSCDIVKDGITGLLIAPQTVEAINQGVDRFEKMKIDTEACRKSANQFNLAKWESSIKERIDKIC